MIRPALLVLCAAGCGPGTEKDEPDAAHLRRAPEPAPAVADSMVLRTPAGAEIWLTEGRAASDSAGIACVERSVEIRTDTSRRKVPLLFVTRPPVLLGPDALRAELSNHCRTTAVYRVDVTTARPTRMADR